MRTRFRTEVTAFCSAAALALGAVLAASAPGCASLTDDASPRPSSAGAFDGSTSPAASTACTSCVTQECTGVWAVCLTDSRCVALRGCNTPFGESGAARAQCFCATADASASTADGGVDPLAAYAAFASCNDARTCGATCTTDCASTCAAGSPKTTAASCEGAADAGADLDAAAPGDAASADASSGDAAADAGDASADAGTPPDAPSVDRCASCVGDKCNDAKKACALATECGSFLACVNGCVDAACVDACGKAHSTGKATATELSSCTLTSCRSACGL